MTPGKWQLLLGVPNIRNGQTSEFTAEVYFQRTNKHGLTTDPAPIRAEAGWYRGDEQERREACALPLFLTLDAAANHGLDFVAFTDHNTISHVKELTALQPYFDKLLLIPGMEMTTLQGHANAFNLREPVDFRVSSTDVPDWNTLLTEAKNKARWSRSIIRGPDRRGLHGLRLVAESTGRFVVGASRRSREWQRCRESDHRYSVLARTIAEGVIA